jgi:hypothetical protein
LTNKSACSPDEAQRNPGIFVPDVRLAPDYHPGYKTAHPQMTLP